MKLSAEEFVSKKNTKEKQQPLLFDYHVFTTLFIISGISFWKFKLIISETNCFAIVQLFVSS